MNRPGPAPDVAIVGGGIIGMSIAWRCAQAGLSVTVHDPHPGAGASTVAAGMLAPVTEAHFGEESVLRLSIAAAAIWGSFVTEVDEADRVLTEVNGHGPFGRPTPDNPGLGRAVPAPDPGIPGAVPRPPATGDLRAAYRDTGTLIVGVDDGDRGEVLRLHRFYRRLGLPARLWEPSEADRIPALSHRAGQILEAPGDHQVDPRRLHAAVWRAALGAGVTVRPTRVTDVTSLDAGVVVLAAGSWSGRLWDLPVRPVRGQVLRLHGPDTLRHTVRILAHGRSGYVVPRADGEIVVGASSTEHGFRTSPLAGDSYTLLRTAFEVLPELAEYELRETTVGLRPGTPDNAPLLGRTTDPRVIAATGHYRQGILLAPITASLITELITTGKTPPALGPFDPLRFKESP